MKKIKINKEDKALIKAYAKWNIQKGMFPLESECSRLIENMNNDHRMLIDDYLEELKIELKYEN